LHWEDFTPGQVTDCGSRVVTRAEIVAFAAEYDPQPMHLDEQAASATLLGGLVASGWHSCCILMRMLTDNLLVDASFMGAPGVEEVKWLAPLRPRRAGHVARDRARDSRLAQPVRPGIRQVPLRARRCFRQGADDSYRKSDVRAARLRVMQAAP
jgi:acyl dehydratase